MPIRPMFLNILLNCMYSGYDPNPSNLNHEISFGRGRRSRILAYHDHQSSKCAEFVQTPLEGKVDQNDWCNNGNRHVRLPLHEPLSRQRSFCSPSRSSLTTASTTGSLSTACRHIFGFLDQVDNGNLHTRRVSA